MKKKKSGPGRPNVSGIALRGALAVVGVTALVPAGVGAQTVESRARAPQRDSVRRFEIAAGSLADAFHRFEDAAALTLRIDAPIVGLQTKGVVGDLTAQQALTQLLDGTGLTFVFTGDKVVRVRSTRAAVLDAVTITADGAARLSSPKYSGPQVDIPRTVSVVTSDVIQAQGATSLRDVLRNVPGLTINAGEGGVLPGDNFNLRGFSATNDIFVDGVRDVSGYGRESFNLEQVEVIKGPNSAVTGRGSTGGSINMVTKSPTLRAGWNASAIVGSANQRRGTLDVNETLPADALHGAAIRVNAVANNTGVAGNDVVENTGWGVAPSVAFGLSTPTRVTLSYTHSAQDNMPSYGLETFNEVPKYDTRQFFGLRTLDFERVRSDIATARVEHAFSNGLSFRNQLTRGQSEVGRIVTPANATTGARNPKSHVFENTVVTNQTSLSAELGNGAVTHSIVGGADVSRERSTRGGYTIATRPFPAIADLNHPTADDAYRSDITTNVTRAVRATTIGAYAFETLRAGSHVEVNAGLRWESYRPEYTDSASRASAFKPAKVDNVSGNAALVVKPAEQASVYVSYGTSFNPSTENLSNDALNAASTLPPEKSRTVEVGAKWNAFKQRLLSSFALFRTEKTNARTSDPANPGLGTILAGRQRVQGAEASVSGQVVERMNVMAGYSFLESKFVESLNPAQQGTEFTNVPKHSVNVWSTVNATDRLQFGGGGRYVDRRLLRATATSTVYVPSYHSYDAMASWRFTPAIGVQLNVLNLTDQLYYDSGRMWVPAPGRALSLTTTVKF